MCVWPDQAHSSLVDEHCLECTTLLPFYHGKGSHGLVTQCVRVRPRRGHKKTGCCLFVLTNMWSLLQKYTSAHKKQEPKTNTQSTLCSITLLAILTKSAHTHKHVNETHAGAVNSDVLSWFHAPTDGVAPGHAFPTSPQAFQAPHQHQRQHTELDNTNTPDNEDKP